MSVSAGVRFFHRWVSAIFTVFVILVFFIDGRDMTPDWVVYLPLAPLMFLLVSGLYLFALPYVRGRRP